MVGVGLTLLGIGSIGVWAAVILEIKFKEPIYKILMKVFPWVMAVGAIIVAFSD